MKMENYQRIVDDIDLPCCVISVERKEDGCCGKILIVCANDPYREAMPAFYEGMAYDELVPKDSNFEDFLFRTVFDKRHMHAYVETKAFNNWTDQNAFPLKGGDENLGYCLYFAEHTDHAKASLMSSVSIATAQAIISCCIKMQRSRDFKSGMDQTIREIRDFTAARSARIIFLDEENKVAFNLCKASSIDTGQPASSMIGYDIVKSWEKMFEETQTNCIIIKDENDYEYLSTINPLWVESLKDHDVDNLFMIPLKQDKITYAYLYLTNFDSERFVEIKEFVELISFFLGTEIANRLIMTKLERLSLIDTLTSLNNRYSMRQHIIDLLEKQHFPFGVLMIDLNGLKTTNDLYGHEYGDEFILKCVRAISTIFPRKAMYRIGGDEFAIICEDLPKEAFLQKAEQLKTISEENNDVSFSSGYYWVETYIDPKEIFRLADEDMYRNKRDFYQRHPEKSRRSDN